MTHVFCVFVSELLFLFLLNQISRAHENCNVHHYHDYSFLPTIDAPFAVASLVTFDKSSILEKICEKKDFSIEVVYYSRKLK